MSGQTLREKVSITNPHGLHMRPASKLAALAKQYSGEVWVIKDDQRVDGKSVLELMTLCALPGEELTIEVTGPEAKKLLQALIHVVQTPVEEAPEPPPLPPGSPR